ncbi:MAG TPA: hypothetical protein VLE49_20420, partial [Anaerolineales bacterium]|nr:hypothetical protein [Anaerolineales bacterium]
MPFIKHRLLFTLGILLVATYVLAYSLHDLRENTVAFEYLFFAAFILYGIACFYALGSTDEDPRLLYWIFGLAAVTHVI